MYYIDSFLTILNYRFIKQFAWLIAAIQSLLIVASRKHYTVDVVVAWYELFAIFNFYFYYNDSFAAP